VRINPGRIGSPSIVGVLVACAVVTGSAVASERPRGIVSSDFIADDMPTPQCHASTIAESTHGLVAAWFGGTHEKHPDVGIWVARFVGGAWTEPVEVADGVQYRDASGVEHRHPCWNPVLFQPKNGPLMLFYKVGPTPRDWWGMLMTSEDGGATWSIPRRLPEGILGPVKNKPVEIDGALLCPTSKENDGWRAYIEVTRDAGLTWQLIGPLNDGKQVSAIQPSILVHQDGRLQILCRSREGHLTESWSGDGGQTWSEVAATALPNPNAGTDAVTLADGRHVLVYNNPPSGRVRSPLTIAVSDDGVTWRDAAVLEDEPASEFSYPAVIQSADGMVHVTYTWKRLKIRHVVADPSQW